MRARERIRISLGPTGALGVGVPTTVEGLCRRSSSRQTATTLANQLYRFGGDGAGRAPRIDRSVSSTTGSEMISPTVRPMRRRQLG